MFLMYKLGLENFFKKVFFKFFSSKVNPNGRGATGELLEHAWGARFSELELSRNTFSTDILCCMHLAVFSTAPSASSSYVFLIPTKVCAECRFSTNVGNCKI